jgi:hypothetical protein
MVLTSANKNGDDAVAMWGGRGMANYQVEFTYVANSESLDLGFMLRSNDYSYHKDQASNSWRGYYLKMSSYLISLYRHDYGAMLIESSRMSNLFDGNEHVIKAVVVSNTFKVYVDGVLTIDCKDGNAFTYGKVGIFVSEANLEIKADLEIYFQLNVFESNRFWAKLSGGVDIDAPIHLRFGGKQLKKEKEIPVFEFTPVFTAFALGPFVVPVVIRNGFIFKYSGAIDANLSMMVPFYYKANFETGPKYEGGQWGSFKGFDWHAGINYEKLAVAPAATLSLEAGAGFYFHTGAYFGGAIGPYFEIGPQAEVSANAALAGNNVLFNTSGSVSIGGEVGAEIKIWKFDLGKKKISYKVAEKDLWDIDLRFDQKDIIGALNPQQ